MNSIAFGPGTRRPSPIADIVSAVCETIAKETALNPDSIYPDQHIADLPDIRSIALMRAVSRLEERFDVALDDNDLFEVITVADLAALIDQAVRSHSPVEFDDGA